MSKNKRNRKRKKEKRTKKKNVKKYSHSKTISGTVVLLTCKNHQGCDTAVGEQMYFAMHNSCHVCCDMAETDRPSRFLIHHVLYTQKNTVSHRDPDQPTTLELFYFQYNLLNWEFYQSNRMA